MNQLSFSVIGGDLRQIELCNYLRLHGHHVSIFGFSDMETNLFADRSPSLKGAIQGADIIVGPIPCSQNNTDLFTKFNKQAIELEDLWKEISPNQIFMAGRLTDPIEKTLMRYGITYIDLLKRDDLAIRNAIPTKYSPAILF